ncbi:MAG: acyl-CoA synthetase FdrA [Pseudomonadota bacterium]
MIRVIIRKDAYYDSVLLMEVNSRVKRAEGLQEVVVAMATPQNLQLLAGLGFGKELEAAAANDLIIAMKADDDSRFGDVEAEIDELLHASKKTGAGEDGYRPPGLEGALQLAPDANLAVISVAGDYAWYEARKALQAGLHVMLFSNNVPVEREVELKKMAVEKGLLVMGPDCGTAIINGVPLCFANEVRRGGIGIVGASGTGTQEVSVLIDRLGQGVSQVIGTGGRDLSAQVGGLTMLQGVEALKNDPETKVIVVVSKPPDEKVSRTILDALAASGKPYIVHFIGRSTMADSLEQAAGMAVGLLEGGPFTGLEPLDRDVALAAEESSGKSEDQKYIRGYFTGGTLCDETIFILSRSLQNVRSNIHPDKAKRLKDPAKSEGHTLIDLGDDVFTAGRPHPMIDPTGRIERIESELDDPEIAIMLLDIMLGHGSHMDPAGAMVPVLARAKKRSSERGGKLTIIATVVGTPLDFQGYAAQRARLEQIGVIVAQSNARMAGLALAVMENMKA